METHIVIIIISSSALLALVYFYIYTQNRQRYIAFWGFSWAVYSLSFIADFLLLFEYPEALVVIIKSLLYILSSCLLLIGSCCFIEKKMPIFWFLVPILNALWIFIGALLDFSLIFITIPTCFFLCFISAITGAIFLEFWEIEGIEKQLTGWMFIVWGIHKGYFPFVQPDFWFSPWGYLTAAILTLILNICLLLSYFIKTNTDLINNEKLLHLIANNAQDIIFRFRIKPSWEFEYISPAVSKIIGLSPEDFYQNPRIFLKLIHPDEKRIFYNLNNYCNSDYKNYVFRWFNKSGSLRWAEQRSTLIRNSKGELTAVEGIIRDITKQKEAEEEQRKFNNSKQQLIENISHDLRTPITLIQGYLEAIIGGVVEDPQSKKQYLKLIHEKVLKLNQLITDLFELTYLSSSKLNLSKHSVRNLIYNIYDKYEHDVTNYGLSFILSDNINLLKDSDEPFVLVDFNLIDRLFANLIYNAVEYTPVGGTINIGWTVTDRKTSSKQADKTLKSITFFVKDNGQGILEKDLPYIFKRFFKGSTAGDNGKGIGLAIAKEIVEMHKGEIWADSKPGKGSTFYFTLPVFN